MTRIATTLDRQTGRYYTPGFLVDAMLRLALVPLIESRRKTLRILDPSCGDGAFLLAIQDFFKSHARAKEMSTIRLCGVDIDRSALDSFRERSGPDSEVFWGDALTGRGFGDLEERADDSLGAGETAAKLDWPTAFPEAFEAGGFDLVIGNPPYRRELASKPMLDRLKQSPLAKRWQQPRLDLWAYFLHRGLDLLKEGGRLAFVLPGYWTASTGARQLIQRLQNETTLRDVVLLGPAPLFPGVSGRHLILSLENARCDHPCRVWDLSDSGGNIADRLAAIPQVDAAMYLLNPADLFQNGGLCLSKPDPRVRILTSASRWTLEDRFQVRQGIVENPRRITRKIAEREPGDFQAGQGVFVVNAEELSRLDLSPEESELLRPYYRSCDVERYHLAAEPSEFLFYLTRKTAPRIADFPKVHAHLERFRSLLENRREVKKGRIAWWHLHWPRDESIFLAPRILMPQMGHVPRFVCCERPAFAGFAMHLISPSPNSAAEAYDDSLWALAGLLNSELAARWFRRFAKHRGASLDISGSLLKQFPLPPLDHQNEQTLDGLVRERQRIGGEASAQAVQLEAEIDSLVEDWYAGSS